LQACRSKKRLTPIIAWLAKLSGGQYRNHLLPP
jgi:hypothetical protein